MQNDKIVRRLISVCVLFTLSSVIAFAQKGKADEKGNVGRGKQLYVRHCVGCHGVRGDGEGENARWLDPKPRDFTEGVFKCRSNSAGNLPLDIDLYHTLSRGLADSAMPSFNALTHQQRLDLVAYVKKFSPRFAKEKPGEPIQIPPETPSNEESILRGKALFEKMECSHCHGAEGRGNGQLAATLTDNKGRPISPHDFTSSKRFKCGDANEDLYRTFMTGLDGTPMPSFAATLQPAEAWDVVHYLRSLQSAAKPSQIAGLAVQNK